MSIVIVGIEASNKNFSDTYIACFNTQKCIWVHPVCIVCLNMVWQLCGSTYQEERPGNSKSDGHGRATSSWTWTAKSVCSHDFRIAFPMSKRGVREWGKRHWKVSCCTIKYIWALTERAMQKCEDLAVEWNTKPLPEYVQLKLLKTIPLEVANFLNTMKTRTGAVFIAFTTFTNENGKQKYSQYETEGLNFFEMQKGYDKGPNNIIEAAEEADSHEQLELDDEQYPKLPDKILGFRLHHRKAILRQPRKGKGKARYVEPDDADDAEMANIDGDHDTDKQEPVLPLAVFPLFPPQLRRTTSASSSAITHQCSSHPQITLCIPHVTVHDLCYQKLILLLRAAKDGDLLEGSPPTWASWASGDSYLPDTFYDPDSSSSLSAFRKWTATDPITADGNMLALYEQVELVILAFGLALRALWAAQFPDEYSQVPTHVLNRYKTSRRAINTCDCLQKQSMMSGTSNASKATKKPLDGMPSRRVPSALQPFREEVGLAGADWDALGPEWQALATLWLRAETWLSKSECSGTGPGWKANMNRVEQFSMPYWRTQTCKGQNEGAFRAGELRPIQEAYTDLIPPCQPSEHYHNNSIGVSGCMQYSGYRNTTNFLTVMQTSHSVSKVTSPQARDQTEHGTRAETPTRERPSTVNTRPMADWMKPRRLIGASGQTSCWENLTACRMPRLSSWLPSKPQRALLGGHSRARWSTHDAKEGMLSRRSSVRMKRTLGAEKDRLEMVWKLAEEQAAIKAAEHDLAAKKKAVQDAQKDIAKKAPFNDEDEDEDDNEDDRSKSPGTSKKESARRRLPQIVHPTPCQLCIKTGMKCFGPIGLACDLCCRQKKSCSNGRPCAHEVAVKEEPKSPTQPLPRKCKARFSGDTTLLTLDELNKDANASVQSLGKRPRMSASMPSNPKFDGVVIQKPMRRSTRVAKTSSSKRQIYKCMAQEHATLVKSYDELAELTD
ncbi:hypothetical protein BJV78DRAFT_1158275 [Lactifluus subvellereus]|nr:hypothetical protein BJV78DRAFT_1158275 [Lactifluus subvellereus]